MGEGEGELLGQRKIFFGKLTRGRGKERQFLTSLQFFPNLPARGKKWKKGEKRKRGHPPRDGRGQGRPTISIQNSSPRSFRRKGRKREKKKDAVWKWPNYFAILMLSSLLKRGEKKKGKEVSRGEGIGRDICCSHVRVLLTSAIPSQSEGKKGGGEKKKKKKEGGDCRGGEGEKSEAHCPHSYSYFSPDPICGNLKVGKGRMGKGGKQKTLTDQKRRQQHNEYYVPSLSSLFFVISGCQGKKRRKRKKKGGRKGPP